jgi:fructose-bisphosphate aldolase class II
MPLVNSSQIYEHAQREGYVVPGFDSYCLEVVQAQIMAAHMENAPFLLQVTPKAFRHMGISYFTGMAMALIEESRVPVALHLDHGTSIEEVVRCVQRGFSSVMIDGSRLGFEQNVALTRKVVEVSHAVGVSVEAELGKVLGKESDIEVMQGEESFTEPAAAEEFVERTGVDSLAVSVGNLHGFYRDEPHIDFERLEEIHNRVEVPLVLHGGSGLGPQIVTRAGSLGVRKINIGTLIKDAFTRGLLERLDSHPLEIDPRPLLGFAREKVVSELRSVIQYFGAAHRSWI